MKSAIRQATHTIVIALPLVLMSLASSADDSATKLDSRAAHNLFRLPLIRNLQDIGYRVTGSDGNSFDGLTRYAVFADFGLPWTWSGRNGLSASTLLTVEAGRMGKDAEYRNVFSLGPTLRFTNDRWSRPVFVDVGLSPTIIDGSRYGDKQFGSTFNFTSHVALGFRFGRNKAHSVKLRYEHISNAGFGEDNPGVNMLGIDFVFWSQ